MEPISFSDYPAPADERSQMQVRQERKCELTEKAQQTADSRADPQTRQRLLDGIQDQLDANSREITQLRFKQEARKKAETEGLTARERDRRNRLDTRA